MIRTLAYGDATNARVDIGPHVNATGNFTYAPLLKQQTFVVRRAAAGAVTVPLVVEDACGTWRTFVGHGTNSF